MGADIGGTFTDLVMLRSDGNYSVQKVPSTVEDFSRGIVEGLDAFLSDNRLTSELVSEIIHGTTVATNAILQNQGARTAAGSAGPAVRPLGRAGAVLRPRSKPGAMTTS